MGKMIFCHIYMSGFGLPGCSGVSAKKNSVKTAEITTFGLALSTLPDQTHLYYINEWTHWLDDID